MMKIYAITYFSAMAVALAIVPQVIKIAGRFGIYDRSGERKVHSGNIARIGGVAVFVAMTATMAAVYFLPSAVKNELQTVSAKLIAIFLGAAILFFVGLADDIKPVKPYLKFVFQLIAAGIVCAAGIKIKVIVVPDLFSIDFGIFSWPFTMLWLVGVTNAINFIDGLDGLAAGISAIACGTIAALAVYFGQPVLCVMMLAMAGALSGFLFFNFNPAKIFMGDCGSLFIGFVIASATVLCTAKSQALVGFALPLLALGVPIFDTLFIMLDRVSRNKPVFEPDSEHFHHRLLRFGLKQRHVVIFAYIITLLATGAGAFLMAARSVKSIMVFVSTLVLIILVFNIIGAVTVKQIIKALKRKYD